MDKLLKIIERNARMSTEEIAAMLGVRAVPEIYDLFTVDLADSSGSRSDTTGEFVGIVGRDSTSTPISDLRVECVSICRRAENIR